MGKGDKRSRKGKRIIGTYGVSRPKVTTPNGGGAVATADVAVAPVKAKATPKKAAKAETKKAPAAKKAEPKKTAAKKSTTKGDDLTKLEGVGPKVKEVLTEAGFGTFDAIAKADATKIGEILVAANSRYKMFDPTTWPKQAQLAADGKWDELKTLQDELDGGKAK